MKSRAALSKLVMALTLSSVAALGVPSAATAQFALTRVAAGLAWPVWVTAPAGDGQRLFVVEQAGLIRIVKDGRLLRAPFLDLSGVVTQNLSQFSERGLLGLAFHPQYASNGVFFVNYTNLAGDTRIVRYRVSATEADVADPTSATPVLDVDQPYSNHNGGTVAFGPRDGYLYVGMGDGGSANDPQYRAQNLDLLLGKMLRLDVDGSAPYAIPADNPFAAAGGPRDEIWAYGLRNPYRFSFDPLTGDLYIADVGQNDWEEIDWQAGDAAGGANYGWNKMEANHCFDPLVNCNDGTLILPVHEYGHDIGCSVTGGAVYRGTAIPALQGHYFFSDYCVARLWSLKMVGGAATQLTQWPQSVVPGTGAALVENIAAIAPDGVGELYVVDRGQGQDGELWKIVPTGTQPNERHSLGGVKAMYGGR